MWQKIASLATLSPTAVQIIPFLPLGEWEPFIILLTATLKILFASDTLSTLQQTVKVKRKDDLKDPFNEHRRPVDRHIPSSRPAVLDHFLSDNHLPNDIELAEYHLFGGACPLSWTKRGKQTREKVRSIRLKFPEIAVLNRMQQKFSGNSFRKFRSPLEAVLFSRNFGNSGNFLFHLSFLLGMI